ncbi:peptidylprolyl isomerase [Aquabacterium sp.]|uniref:peptidylprolyl isomerase n=1 Tax=Aquabacterium sp. TaxID=1872578 RepID=UPI002C0BADE1|nr:peptidylprolyl isomerase [Aquabacterium sp.]HSW08053.1 peptidylprolyl isomerase [Aquabacterium sp.]
MPPITLALLAALCLAAAPLSYAAKARAPARPASAPAPPTTAEVLQASSAGDWRALDASHTLLMELASGPVLIELAPRFAPRHVANILTLTRERYFDGLAVLRVQDNYVAQWGDPDAEAAEKARPLGKAERKLPAEFDVPLRGLPLTPLADADGWAPVTGWVDGFPVAADPRRQRAWLAHCYGMVGAGRDNPADSSNGTELYAVIGHSPRGLDRNITVVGRVLSGIDKLSALPRGGNNMGFYDQPEQRHAIRSVRVLDELPPEQRPALEVLRTDTATWRALLEARRNRREPWFVHRSGHIGLCNATVPTRPASKPTS